MAVFTGTFDGIKVFSSTMAGERAMMGEKISEWLEKNKDHVFVVGSVVTQSSDNEFHCVTITVFYNGKTVWNPAPPEKKERFPVGNPPSGTRKSF